MKKTKNTPGRFGNFDTGAIDPVIFLDGFDDAVILLDSNFNIQFMNRACQTSLEYSDDDLLNAPFLHLLGADANQETVKKLGECLQMKKAKYELEHVILKKGGATEKFKIAAFPLRLADESVNIVLHLKNITEIEHERDFANMTAALYDAIAEQASEGFFMHDFEGRFVQVNQQACDDLGYTRGELLTMSVTDVDQDFDLKSAQAEWSKIEPGVRSTLYGHHRRKDGTVFPVVISFGCAILHGEKYFLGLARDITDIEQTEEKYRAMVEGAPDPIFIQTEKKFAYLNPAACVFFGVGTPEALIGTPVLDRVSPEFRELAGERIRRLNEDRASVNEIVEQKFIRCDGSAVWAQTKGEPIIYNGKKSALVFARNTTKRRVAEEALRKSEKKYETLFSEANIPILLVRYPELTTVDVNGAFVRTLGFSREEVIGKRSDDLGIIHLDGNVAKIADEIERAGSITGVELKAYTKAGEELTMLCNISLLDFDNEKYALITNLDITARKKAELKFFEISERFQKVFDYSAAGMTITGLDGRFIDVNLRMCEMLGYSKEELRGMPFSAVTYPEDVAASNDMIRRMLSGEVKFVTFEKRYVRRNGEVFWAVANSTVLRDQSGSPVHFITQLRDISEQKAAEERLREINERYQKSFDFSPIGMCLTDLDGRLLYVNRKFCEMLGYAREELEGESISDLTYAEDKWITDENYRRVKRGEAGNLAFEKRYIRRDGAFFWSYVVVTVLMGPDERPDKCIVQIQDITERRRMEEELRSREAFSRAVMDNLPIGISVNSYEPPLVFEYMNDNFPRFYRTTREALTGADVFFDAVYEDPEYREVIRDRVLADMRSGDPARMRWENIPISREGSETRYISANNVPVPGRNMHISIVTDETERVLTLEALEKNAARFLKLHEFDQAIIRGFETAGEIGEAAVGCLLELIGPGKAGIGIINAEGGNIELITADRNRKGFRHRLLPMTVDETSLIWLLKRGGVSAYGDITDRSLKTLLRRLLGFVGEKALLRPLCSAASPIGILCIAEPESGAFTETDREIVEEFGLQSVLAIEQHRLELQNARYATELEQMIGRRTAQLEEAVKELEAFTYSVSHDLRAPLRSLSGFVRILLEDYGERLDDEGRRVCGVIAGGAQQMGRLIDDLLALSRVARSTMALMPVDMEAMVNNQFNELTTEKQRARVSFSVGRLPEAVADPTLIRLVWMNLLDNALKFSAKKSEARISVEGARVGDELVYTVTDNGAGFNMKYADKLFGVFQRLHTVNEFDGTGVGLAIVQRIIHRHGGRVWAQGEEDRGATFYFSLKMEAEIDDT